MKVGDYLFVYGPLGRGGEADLSKQTTVQYIEPDNINGSLAHFGFLQELRPVLLLSTASNNDWLPWLPYIHGDVFRIRHASIISLLDAYCRWPDGTNRTQVMTRRGRHAYVYSHKELGNV